MKTLAAVLVETGKPLVLAELEIPPLKPGQVLVEVAFSGACHTLVLEWRGFRGRDPYLPHCLGHEGTGIVVDVGPGVTKVKTGDRVILSWMKGSGADVGGTTYQWNGSNVSAGGVTTFSRYSVSSENRLTVIPKDIPMSEAALLGCSIPAAVGSVLNTAQPKPGQGMAVFGVGGIGLFAIAGASIVECRPIVAIDVRPERLALAKEMGATHLIRADEADPVKEINKITPGGIDFAVDATGRPQAMSQALECVRSQGGTAVIIGNARYGERMELDPWQLNLGKRLLGTWGGDNQPDRDFPRYCEYLRSGKLKVKPVLSKAYRLTEVNEALADLEKGRAIRPLIDLSLS